MLPTKFHVNWPFGQKQRKIDFQDGGATWRPSWISDRNDVSYVCFTKHPDASYQFQVNWPIGSREEAKNIFSS